MRYCLLFLAALVLRLAWFGLIYTDDFSRFQSGDYTLYAIGGEHIRADGNFDNSLFLVRPPLFPLMIAGLNNNTLVVVLVNVVLGACAAPLTMAFARQAGLASGWALLAGGVVAVDPPSVIYSVYLGPEALANLLLLLALLSGLIGLKAEGAARWGVVMGLLLGLASLVRPASYLLAFPLALLLIIFLRHYWRFALALLLTSGAMVGIWTAHNGVVFGNPIFSTIGTYNLLYYRAVSVEYQATGRPLDTIYSDLSTRVEERMGRDTSAIDAGTRHRHYTPDVELQQAMQSVALEVFLAHPLVYLYTLPVGFVRIFITVGGLPAWAYAVTALWNSALLLLALVGGGWAWQARQRHGHFLLIFVVVLGYFTLGTLLVQTSGIDTRARTMLTPVLATSAALTLAYGRGHVVGRGDRRAGDASSP